MDLLRGVAILLVLCRHMHIPAPDANSTWRLTVMDILQRGGWCGVDLFFVLSGFLVSQILFRQFQALGRIDVGQFLYRRGLKIYPSFWFMIGATVTYNLCLGGTTAIFPLWVELAFVQNYFPGLYGHTWSLAVEEHCYLGLVILFVALTKLQPKSSDPFWWLVGLALIGLLAAWWGRRDLLPLLQTNGPRSILFPTHLRFDGFLVGTALGYGSFYRGPLFHQAANAFGGWWNCVGIVLISPVFAFDLRKDSIVASTLLTTNIFAACCFILAAMRSSRQNDGFRDTESQANRHIQDRPPENDSPPLRAGPEKPNATALWQRQFHNVTLGLVGSGVRYVGCNSYSIYIWHDFLEHALLRPALGLRTSSSIPQIELWVPLYLTTTVGGGLILAALIEQPLLRFRTHASKS